MKNHYYNLILILFSTFSFAQNNWNVALIADSLKQNANAVIRYENTNFQILSKNKLTINTKQVITVFNEKGLNSMETSFWYDNLKAITSIKGKIYDAFGNELKKIKRSDFEDRAAIDGFSIFNDTRFITLDYTPTSYPFTYEIEVEETNKSTAFVPTWYLNRFDGTSIEKAILSISCPPELGLRFKEQNLSNLNFEKSADENTFRYEFKNLKSIKTEPYADPDDVIHIIKFALAKFNLEGVDAEVNTWKDFGIWQKNELLKGTDELPEETKQKIQALVANEKDLKSKVRKIYQYIQDKVRYVSIQVGIGGWKPMLAKDVDRLGYGDCKALSNYTRTLLNAVGIESYYTLVYGKDKLTNIDKDFVSIQGNHAILGVPNGNEMIWLECTSQTNPFGYIAGFTDDRDVLVIKPEGGEIMHTKAYTELENKQISKTKATLSENGDLEAKITMTSEGTQFSNWDRFDISTPKEQDLKLKNQWSFLNNLQIVSQKHKQNKTDIVFENAVDLFVPNYAQIANNQLILTINCSNRNLDVPSKIRNRKTNFTIQRGYVDQDEITYTLPKNFAIDFLPENVSIETPFGIYKTTFKVNPDKTLTYTRYNLAKKGKFAANEYENFRQYRDQISRNDFAKIILKKI